MTKKATLSEIRAMKDRGDVSKPAPDAKPVDMPDGFWDDAQVVQPNVAKPPKP